MNSMDCASPSTEPPERIRKTTDTHDSSRVKTQAYPSSPTPNIVQRIKYVLALDRSEHITGKRLHYQQVDDNLTVFDLDGVEHVAVNASLDEISQWKPQRLPHQHFWVKNTSE